ncbi:MAG: toxin-activating lysine-acyltransferase [Ottowia sp.]|nr:toxin-activating lysine-acyltransferase [Ottowia sp.]
MSIDLLGQIAWLWVNSPLQKDWPMHLLGTNVIPAIEHQQFLLLKQDDIPVAYCSWAFLDLAAEQRYLADAHGLSLRDWVSGDRMWLIDWVAPFGHSFALYRQMRARSPLSIARAIRVDPEKKTARVQEMMGRSVSKQAAAEKFKQYFDEAMSTPRP